MSDLPSANGQSAAQVRYDEIQALRQAGLSQRAIAKQLHLDRRTVHRYFCASQVPERGYGPQSISSVRPYWGYLQQRWTEGSYTGKQLWQELQARGYHGSYSSVYRALTHFPRVPTRRAQLQRSGEAPRVSAPQAAWLLVRPATDLTAQEVAKRDALLEKCTAAAVAYPLSQRFGQMVRERQAEQLEGWFTETADSSVPELRHFASNLRRDEPAIRAALTLAWSNGPVEGHVNRLKTIKRQMYGRGKFDLLRRRVLYRSD